MRTSLKSAAVCLLATASLLSSLICAHPVQAAHTVYDDGFDTVAKLGESNACYSSQGMAAGDNFLYAVQIGDDDARAVIHRVDRRTGGRELMELGDTGKTVFTNLGHCNGMDLAVIDGVEYLYTASEGKVVAFRIDGNKLYPHAEYELVSGGSAFTPSAVVVYKLTDTRITFLFKSGRTLYMGSASLAASQAKIAISSYCTIDVTRVAVNGKVQNYSSFVNQGMGFKDGFLFVPITGNDDDATVSHSLILTYDMNQARSGSKLQPVENKTYYVISDKYSALFEVEDCAIAGDGRMYFNTNSRVTNRDTKHDGVFVLKDFVLSSAVSDKSPYSIRYDAGGGLGEMGGGTAYVGDSITLPECGFFSRDSFFMGWQVQRSSDGAYLCRTANPKSIPIWRTEEQMGDTYSVACLKIGTTLTDTWVPAGDTMTLCAVWRLCGDANGDGALNIRDVVALRLYAEGGYPIRNADAQYLDVTGDGTVNASDAMCLFAYLAGAFDGLPGCQ